MGGSINHSQSFIFSGSYHFTTIGEWVGAGSFAWGRVTVEKLSGQTKCMAVTTCAFGMFFFYFVPHKEGRINVHTLMRVFIWAIYALHWLHFILVLQSFLSLLFKI